MSARECQCFIHVCQLYSKTLALELFGEILRQGVLSDWWGQDLVVSCVLVSWDSPSCVANERAGCGLLTNERACVG